MDEWLPLLLGNNSNSTEVGSEFPVYSSEVQLPFSTLADQIFHYTRCITPKRVSSLRDLSPRHCAQQNSSFRRNVASVASRW